MPRVAPVHIVRPNKKIADPTRPELVPAIFFLLHIHCSLLLSFLLHNGHRSPPRFPPSQRFTIALRRRDSPQSSTSAAEYYLDPNNIFLSEASNMVIVMGPNMHAGEGSQFDTNQFELRREACGGTGLKAGKRLFSSRASERPA